jgi:hypothetical protein
LLSKQGVNLLRCKGAITIGTEGSISSAFPTWDENTKKVTQEFWAELGQIRYDLDKFIYLPPLPKVGQTDYHNTLRKWTKHDVDLAIPAGSDEPLVL